MSGRMTNPWKMMPPITVIKYSPNFPATTFKSSISMTCDIVKKNIPIGEIKTTHEVTFIIIVLTSVTSANNMLTLPCIVLIATPNTQALTTKPIIFIPLPYVWSTFQSFMSAASISIQIKSKKKKTQ